MRVLVAGDRGYIGTVLVPFLRAAGHEADGLDLGWYEGCDLGPALCNYRVDFSKLAETFPDLSLRWSVREGVEELAGTHAKYGLTYDDFVSSRFVRLRRIRELLSAGVVDETLRRKTDQPLLAARPRSRRRRIDAGVVTSGASNP